MTHGTKNPLSFGKNLNTAVENKWIIVVLFWVWEITEDKVRFCNCLFEAAKM